jgi:hypothetical protein
MSCDWVGRLIDSKDLEGKDGGVIKIMSGYFSAVIEKDHRHKPRPSLHSIPWPLHKNDVLPLQSICWINVTSLCNVSCDVIAHGLRNVFTTETLALTFYFASAVVAE